MNTNDIMQYASYSTAVIGGTAFLVAAVVQTVKELPMLRKLPTSGVAFYTSIVICMMIMLIWRGEQKLPITGYSCIFALLEAFPVYLAATGGWERLHSLWKRTHSSSDEVNQENCS